MTKLGFNLQGIDSDLEIEIKKSKEYFEWRNTGLPKELKTEIVFDKDPSFCPVGSIEFTESILGPQKPLIPPPSLRKWFGRAYGEKEIPHGKRVFLKSINHLKDPGNGWYSDKDLYPEGEWFWTEEVRDVIGEFRVFLYRRGEILDIRNYIGFETWPNMKVIENMARDIFEYYERPVSFDVMVNSEGGTFLLEIHDYFALGLYGFSNPGKIPYLLLDWYNSCVRRLQK